MTYMLEQHCVSTPMEYFEATQNRELQNKISRMSTIILRFPMMFNGCVRSSKRN